MAHASIDRDRAGREEEASIRRAHILRQEEFKMT